MTPPNKTLRRILFLISFVLGIIHFLYSPPVATADVIIIANKDVPDDALSKEEIKRIFLGKKKKWNDNSPITIVLGKNSPAHRELLMKYIDRTPSQFVNVWKRQVFTGEATYPRSFPDDATLIDFVASKKGAVGYLAAPPLGDNVKIIRTE